MSSLRLLLVARRFWPLVGGAESIVGSLAAELRRQGAEPTILSARWQSDWPAEIVYRGVRVIRLTSPGAGGWGTLRYVLALARWLRGHAGEFDLVHVSTLRHDAFTALEARGRGGYPVVLRAEGTGERGDCAWHQKAPFGRRIARVCRTAEAIVAPSAAAHEELLRAGFPSNRLHLLPNGVAIPKTPADAAASEASRAVLAEANPDLALPEGVRLAVYTGRLDSNQGLLDLLEAWRIVTAQRRDAWLWLVGEGPLEETLRLKIDELGLAGRVVLGGVFDDVEDLLRAADLLVQPSPGGPSLSLLEAMAAGVPVVATDTSANRELIEPERHGLLAKPDDPSALATAIEALLSDPARARSLAAAARERVGKHFSLAKMAREHLELFDRLLTGARP